MTATERLCKLLDERGVKYYDMQTLGIWFGISEDGKDHKFEAFEQIDGLIEIEVYDLTPEQAIAVTLGSEREKELEKLVQKALDECWCDEWWYEDARKLGLEANY